MNIIKFLYLLSEQMSFKSMFGFGIYSSEEYIFKETLHKHLLRVNPELNSYKLGNTLSNYSSLTGIDLVQINEVDRLKSYYNLQLERIEKRLQKKFEKFKSQIAERDGESSELFKYLNTLSYKELIEYYLEFENNYPLYFLDLDLRDYISVSYIEYDRFLTISKRLSVLVKITKSYRNQLFKSLQDRRVLFRKLLSFLFKNLDDYHERIIIKNMLFVAESQLPVLTFNNYSSEKKYFKQN